MSTKINVETFIAILRKSGLVDRERLDAFLRDDPAKNGPTDDAAVLCDRLIAENLITKWQSEKLLQGKHRGYFLGKYKLLSLLGKGGMSSVYLAEHLLLRRRCALKVLPAKRVDDSSYLERFHREAQAVASLDHPNIVRAYDVDHQTDGDRQIHFLVMEFVDGQSLQELVTEHGLPTFLDSVEYARQAAAGLKQAHEQGMIHRDVKPGNLLVDQNGVVKILDLGLARFFTVEEGNDALTIRHDEKVLGTADYLAPEQALDSHTVDVRADIYSLGCTLYFLVTGQPPFTEGTLAQRLMAHQVKTPPTVESLRPDTPLSLAMIIRKMMAKQASDRYPTAAETEKALFNWVNENADDRWRKIHSDVYGVRNADVVGSVRSVPVAQPVVAKANAEQVTETARKTLSKPISSKVRLPKPAPPDPPAAGNDTSLNQFFSTLTQSNSGVAPVKTDSSARKATATKENNSPGRNDSPVPSLPSRPGETESPFPQFTSPFDQLGTPDAGKPAGGSKSSLTKSSSIRIQATKAQDLLNGLKRLKAPQWIGVGGVVLILLIVAIYVSVGMIDNGSTKQVTLSPFPKDKHQITVGGSKAEYPNIRSALIAVRDRYRPRKDNTEPFFIRIAPGTYNETIVVNGRSNRWPEGVTLLGEGEVHLEAPGAEPIVYLASVSRFVIENIQIDAQERRVAIEVTGDLHESRFSNLVIRDFSDIGILCKGAQGLSFGTNQLLLEQLKFEPTGTQAVGIRFEEGADSNVESVVVRGCRFLGPMAAGIEFQDQAPYGIDITESIFNMTSDGIRFNNQPLLKAIHIVNNSFRQTRNGIRFSKFPKDLSTDVAFRRNLFINTDHGELVIQQGYDEGKFRAMLSVNPAGIENNWSDRAKPAIPYDDEIVLIFEQGGKQGEAGLALISTDPKSPKFLVPMDNSPLRNVPGTQPIDKHWVGAIGQ